LASGLAADLRRAVCDEGVRKIDHFTQRHHAVLLPFPARQTRF
jgi:hypothetical protein